MTLSSLERLKLESYLSNKLVQRDDRIRAQALLPKLPTEGTLETWGRLFSCAAEIGIKDSLIILHYALQNGLVHKQCTEGPLIQRDAILDWLNLDNNLPAIWRCYCSSYQGEPAQFPQGEPDKPEQGAAVKEAAQPETSVAAPVSLSLVERARLGLLADESELWLWEIMQLEFPAFTSYEDRQRPDYFGWGKSVEAAIQYGLLGDSPRRVETVKSETHRFLDTRRAYFSGPRERIIHVVGCSDWRVPREPYRTWRATQPNAPTDSLIHLWLSPPPKNEPDKPEQGAAAKHETELQMHKRECQEIGKRLWGENPNSTKTEIMKHPEMLFYVQAYKGKNTISGWLAIIDPRPKSKRRGRPKKIPV